MIRQLSSLVFVAALFACVVSGACSAPLSPSAVDGTALIGDQTALIGEQIGGTWTLVAQEPAGQPAAAPPAGATFQIEIANGRAAVTADCNRCGGPAVVGASTVTVGPLLACTRAYCVSAPFDDAFLQMLAGEGTVTIDGSTLALRSDRGILRFRR